MKRLKVYKDGEKTYFIGMNLTDEEMAKIRETLGDILDPPVAVNDLGPSTNVTLERPKNYKGIPWEKLPKEQVKNPSFVGYINKEYLKLTPEAQVYMLKEDMGPWLLAIEDVEQNVKFVKNYIYEGRDMFFEKICSWMQTKGKKSDYKLGTDEFKDAVKEIVLESSDEDLFYVFGVIKKLML